MSIGPAGRLNFTALLSRALSLRVGYGLPTPWVEVAHSSRSCDCFRWIFRASMSQNLLIDGPGSLKFEPCLASIVNSMIGKALSHLLMFPD